MAWPFDTNSTRAYDEWRWTDRDQRAFLTLGLKFTREAYQRLWDQIGEEPSDGSEDWDEVFDQRVGGLWPHDYEWLHLAAVVRDAVTSFEVYLDKTCLDVLLAHGAEPSKDLRWRDMKQIFEALGVNIETGPVKRIRTIRHVLTHRRGELRTEQQRQQYALDPTETIPSFVIELNDESVIAMLDELADAVRRIDAVATRFTWKREHSDRLEELIEASLHEAEAEGEDSAEPPGS